MGIVKTQKRVGSVLTTEVHYESPQQKITITSLGASIKRYETRDKDNQFESIVMHYENDDLYINNPKFLGATIGPYAGRIYPAKLNLNNQTYTLEQNFLNHANLHSGTSNFAFNNFACEILNESQVAFTLTSPKDDQFPGPVDIKLVYTFNESSLRVDYYTTSVVDTVINMTNHSYFNLSGDLKRDILNHQLTLPSEHYVELDEKYMGIKKRDVSDTPFDFRESKPLKQGITPLVNTPTKGIDHPFYIDNKQAVTLYDPVSKRSLQVRTSYDALVVYTNNLPTEYALNKGQSDISHYAICLEAQHVPNDIYLEDSPKSIIKANEVNHNYIEYTVSVKH